MTSTRAGHNPLTALFITPDDFDPIDNAQARAGNPIGWRNNPVGTNRYAYAGQDPINRRDPTGRCTSFANCLTGGTFMQSDGSVSIESSILLRAVVPGQIAFDHSRTAWANGDRVGAATQAASGLAEFGLTISTLAVGRVLIASERAVAEGLARLGAREATAASTFEGGLPSGATFAQRTFSETFSQGGEFAGKTVSEVAAALRSGRMMVTEVPVQYIVRDGNTLILNTRSAQALEQAGIARSNWRTIDLTGNAAAETRLTGQLRRNGFTSEGAKTVRRSGGD